MIVITSMARQAVFKKVKEEWARFYQIPAVSQDRIHVADSDTFDRPSPRLIEGLEILARLVHPELYPPPTDLLIEQ